MSRCRIPGRALRIAVASLVFSHFAAGGENDGLEQIIVTAQKTEQNLLDVPVSVSVLQGELVEERGAVDITDLNGIAPNVILNNVLLLENGGKFAIRGIGFFDGDPLADQKTQIMIDGVPHARNTGVVYDQVDIQRVEILRGPQGTLFGRGSMAGTINYVSRRAADEPGVAVRLSVGNYDMSRLVATAETGELFDRALRARLTASRRFYGGHRKNAYSGRYLGDKESRNARLRLDHESDFAATSFIFYEVDESSYGVGLTNHIQDPFGVADGDEYLVNIDQDGHRTSSDRGFTILSEIPLSGGHMAVLGNTHTSDYLSYVDLDARVGFFPPAPGSFSNLVYNRGFDIAQQQESLELRYHNEEGGRWDLVTGAFLFRERSERTFHQNIGPPLSETQAFEHAFEVALARQDTESLAVFGQAEYHFGEAFTLIAGGRVTNEEKSADIRTFPLPGAARQAPATKLTPSHAWEHPTWKFGAEYRPNGNVLLYLTASTGYKPGGFNGRATLLNNAGPYSAEFSTSIEAGMKAGLLGNRLRISAAGFVSDYTDIVGLVRRPTVSGRGTEAVNENLGDMSVNGLEFESSWLATPDLVVDFAVGYLDAAWKTYLADLNGDGTFTDNTHFEVLMAPELAAYTAATYSQEYSDSTLRYRLDARYQGRYNTSGRSNDELFFRPGTLKLNASISWIWGRNQNAISIYARNLTDRRNISQAIVAIFPILKFDPPRMVGAELKLNF